jgi:hypothetical protein
VNSHNSKIMTRPVKIFLSINILFLVLLIVPKLMGLYYINGYVDSILLVICFISFFTWIFLIVKNKTSKKWPRVIVVLISVIILAISIPYLLLFSLLSGNACFDSVSPSGKNRLVVLEGGFIDMSYKAYPRVLSIFYKYQDNGFVQKHDFWGGAEFLVDWVSDNYASVIVITGDFDAVSGSNKDDIIIVTFD